MENVKKVSAARKCDDDGSAVYEMNKKSLASKRRKFSTSRVIEETCEIDKHSKS